MAIDSTLSKNIIVSNLEVTVSAHTILTGTLNTKEVPKGNAPDIPKNNKADNANDFPTDRIDVVDRNTITGDNNSISNNIPDNISDNSQQIGK